MTYLYAFLSAIFAALTTIFAKIGLDNINSNIATLFRTIVVVFMAYFLVIITGKQTEITNLSSKNWLFLFLSGLATGLSWLFYYKALQNGATSKIVAIDKLSIVFTFLLAFIFLNEVWTMKMIIGSILITIGVFVMIL